MFLRLGHRLSNTSAEGPGQRYALWVQGCNFRCPKCCNKELWDAAGGQLVDVHQLADEILSTPNIEGITLLGGEPLLQAAALAELAEPVQKRGLTVILFTGYTLAEITAQNNQHMNQLLRVCDVLVDGRYDETVPAVHRWVGSGNQVVRFLSNRYNEKDFLGQNTVEIRFDGKTLSVNGWPRGF